MAPDSPPETNTRAPEVQQHSQTPEPHTGDEGGEEWHVAMEAILAYAEEAAMMPDAHAQAGSAAGNKAMSRHNRPVKAVTGHREMRPIHLDRPRARLPVNSWSHEAPACSAPQTPVDPCPLRRGTGARPRGQQRTQARSVFKSAEFLGRGFWTRFSSGSRKYSTGKRIFG